jgi:hypothetical protein
MLSRLTTHKNNEGLSAHLDDYIRRYTRFRNLVLTTVDCVEHFGLWYKLSHTAPKPHYLINRANLDTEITLSRLTVLFTARDRNYTIYIYPKYIAQDIVRTFDWLSRRWPQIERCGFSSIRFQPSLLPEVLSDLTHLFGHRRLI